MTATQIEFEAIGTRWRIDTGAALPSALRRRLDERITAFDSIWSRFQVGTLVTGMARATDGGAFRFPDEAEALFALYDRLHALTSGAVDPLVGSDLEHLGYDAHYSLIPGESLTRNPRPSWPRDVRRDGCVLVTNRPVVLDVGAAGKGLLVDIVTQLLIDDGSSAIVVDAGGDMRLSGSEAIRIGLEHPFDSTVAIGTFTFDEGALCASAIGRRSWGNGIHHVIDGRTGRPTGDVVATWVRADSAMVADGLATALFFVTADQLAGSFTFSYARMFGDGRAEMSPDFGGELFLE